MDSALVDSAAPIGVIVAAHNAERWIAATLESIRAQTLQNWVCVVVDDGSSDRTAAVADESNASDQRFRVVSQVNRGVSAARNAALALLPADCSLVAIIDSDDAWVPDALEALSSALRGRPDAVGVSAYAEYMDEDGTPVRPGEHAARQRRRQIVQKGSLGTLDVTADTTFQSLLITGTIWPPATALLRRSVISAVGGFDETLPTQEDWELFVRMSRHGPFAYLDRQVAWYRVHNLSLTQNHERNVFLQDVVRRIIWESPENTNMQRRQIREVWSYQQWQILLGQGARAKRALLRGELEEIAFACRGFAYQLTRWLHRQPTKPSIAATRRRLSWLDGGQHSS